MPSLNKVMLIGNVTRDPEVRFTPKGTPVTDVGLAVNRYFTSENNEKREETTFIDITFWGRQAEIIGQFVKKGRPIFVEGRLQMDTWQDKQTGQNRSRLKVIGENVQFLGSRDDFSGSAPDQSDFSPSPQSSQAREAPAAPPQDYDPGEPAPPGIDPAEDDIPF